MTHPISAGGGANVAYEVHVYDAASTIIDTQVVSCAGSGGVFDGSIVAGSGLIVADGGRPVGILSTLDIAGVLAWGRA